MIPVTKENLHQGEDFYQSLSGRTETGSPCSPEEEERLLDEILAGSQSAVKQLVEGKLGPCGQNGGRIQGSRPVDERSGAGGEYHFLRAGIQGGDFDSQSEERIRRMIEDSS